jgi:hypothetical protein
LFSQHISTPNLLTLRSPYRKTALDNDHKEIHFSLSYISSITPASRLTHEITGVLTHELVHCYQWDADGTCPGGLIEGVADWVRLNCDLSPPHWKRETGGGMLCFTPYPPHHFSPPLTSHPLLFLPNQDH